MPWPLSFLIGFFAVLWVQHLAFSIWQAEKLARRRRRNGDEW